MAIDHGHDSNGFLALIEKGLQEGAGLLPVSNGDGVSQAEDTGLS